MAFVKEDLVFDHYTWENTSTSPFMGTPSRRLFNRFNGNQVLFLINALHTGDVPLTSAQVKQLEEMLLNQLPLEAKSEISVLNWMKETQTAISE
jgi:hypothetical protein